MASNAELPDVDRSHPLDPHDEPRVTNELHTDRTGKNTVLNQYERLQRIGTGQHGEVYVAIDSNNKTTVVCILCDPLCHVILEFTFVPVRQSKA